MALDTPVYCTREDVKQALDLKETARSDGAVDRAIQAATTSVEGLCHRVFYPVVATRYFDWPDQYARPWRLWLDDSELISATALSSGGVDIPAGRFNLEPNRNGPPYNRIEIKLDTDSAFGGGSTPQRDIAITGLWAGCRNDEAPAGSTAAGASASATALDVTNSAAIGVGHILRIGTERLLVSDRSMLDTGQALQANLEARQNDQALTVTDGTAFTVGEVLLLGAERMRIDDIAGNTLVVRRAWDGSTLAAHAAMAGIYASRRLTVIRGALGTTAATIAPGAAIQRWQAPAPVRSLSIAEALVDLLQEASGYARTTGVGSGARQVGGGQIAKTQYGTSIEDLRDKTYTSHGRKARIRGV
jgi:hypothetical protein